MKIIKTVLITILVITIASCTKKEEKVIPLYEIKKDAMIPEINKDSVLAFLQAQVDMGPRDPNSAAHLEAKSYFIRTLEKYADKVVRQDFTYPAPDKTLNLTNIIAVFNPAAKNRIILGAHWDSRPWSDQDPDPANREKPILGANDGASGTAILIEIARILSLQKPEYGIDIVLFDGEDYGHHDDLDNYCIGSKYFAAVKDRDYSPAFGIILDLVGDKDAVYYPEYYSRMYAPEIVDMVWNLASDSPLFKRGKEFSIYDDHLPLNQAGIKTINIIDAEMVGNVSLNPRKKYWHTQKDDMSNISSETLAETGRVVLKVLYSIKFNR